jgi:hypothetical protein
MTTPKQIWDAIFRLCDAIVLLACCDAGEDESEEIAKIYREEYDPTFNELVAMIGDPSADHT